ncbi:MAG: CBS domain-containing protein [Nanoarchaeota archaeon]
MKTGFTVHDGMTTKPVTATEDTSVRDCAKLMEKHNIGSILVSAGNKIKGIVTEEDIVRKAVISDLDVKKTPVSRVMTTKLVTISPEKDIYDALIMMRDNDIRHLPVIDSTKKLIGFITLKDILKIEPQLFDIIVEKIELREETKKPVYERVAHQGICEICGEVSEEISEKQGSLVCPDCRAEV